MHSLHSVFHRAAFALALVGTGIAGPQLLPAPAGDARDGCTLAQARAAAQPKDAATPDAAATGSTRRSHAAVAAVRD